MERSFGTLDISAARARMTAWFERVGGCGTNLTVGRTRESTRFVLND
jgi:hypothetical protein